MKKETSSLWSDAFARIARDRVAVACFAVIAAYALVGILAPILFADWAEEYNYDQINASPSAEHPLGTDAFGRSVLQKTLLGASTSLTVGLMVNLISIPLGMLLGAIAGYYGRRIDDLIVWIYTMLSSIPGIILLIAIRFALNGRFIKLGAIDGALTFSFADRVMDTVYFSVNLGRGLPGLCIAMGITGWVGTCRLVRAEVMKIRELEYVQAARALGVPGIVIIFRHVLRNVLHIGIIRFSLGFVGAIKAEVILSYLGLGVAVGTPSWGSMIDAARMDLVVGRWWELGSAVGAMFFLVLALSIFGDRLRDAFDPRLKV